MPRTSSRSGVHHELLAAGRAPGTEVGIVGFDGSDTARMHHLTTVAQPLDQIADRILGLLDDALAGRPRPSAGSVLRTRPPHRGQHVRPIPLALTGARPPTPRA